MRAAARRGRPGPRGAVDRFAVHSATLDDVFLALTGHAADRDRPDDKEPAGV